MSIGANSETILYTIQKWQTLYTVQKRQICPILFVMFSSSETHFTGGRQIGFVTSKVAYDCVQVLKDLPGVEISRYTAKHHRVDLCV